MNDHPGPEIAAMKDGELCPFISTTALLVTQQSIPPGIVEIPQLQTANAQAVALPGKCYREKCQLWDSGVDMCTCKAGLMWLEYLKHLEQPLLGKMNLN